MNRFQPNDAATSLGKRIGKINAEYPPSLMQMSGFRPPSMQQLPCKTINDITLPPAKISNVNELAGYKSYIFGHGDKPTLKTSMFTFPEQHPLNNPILKPANSFFV